MDMRKLTPDYVVAPQISPEDMAEIARAGFTDVICNRPDDEVTAPHDSATMRAAAEAAGLAFHLNPIAGRGMGMDEVNRQRELLDAARGPVFAYCRSGTRCAYVWALSQAGRVATDDLIAAGARGGYDLSGLRDQIERLAAD